MERSQRPLYPTPPPRKTRREDEPMPTNLIQSQDFDLFHLIEYSKEQFSGHTVGVSLAMNEDERRTTREQTTNSGTAAKAYAVQGPDSTG